MLDPLDPWTYEICFPGGITGEAEVRCPHCQSLLTVPVRDPTAEERYRCPECSSSFTVDWGA